ncbi:OsmC family protein [Treponema pedis]|uniref:OsmC family protein n=1 Tax=Treponema pedis TaxID=409322 RepID=UPI0003F8A666|nr:OsmC family protein [Treponema pedis]
MAKGLVKGKAEMDMGAGYKVVCESGGKQFILDEPKSIGGTDLGMNPLEALLNALGACKCVVAKLTAKQQGFNLDSISVECTGTFDSDGFKGLNSNAKIGLSEIETVYNIKTSASQEETEKFIAFVDSHCPVNDTIGNSPKLSHKVKRL